MEAFGGIIILFILSIVFKQDLLSLLSGVPMDTSELQAGVPAQPTATTAAKEERLGFVASVLNDVQDTWTRVLPQEAGIQYPRATLSVFRDTVRSACGFAEAASGPFCRPGDNKVYLDLSFFDELRSRFGAEGEFAQAYVIAHEIGHHVQDVAGVDRQMRMAQQQRPDLANQVSVRLELQADCLTGVRGHSTARQNLIDQRGLETGSVAACDTFGQ